jgi:hypothetical protein
MSRITAPIVLSALLLAPPLAAQSAQAASG